MPQEIIPQQPIGFVGYRPQDQYVDNRTTIPEDVAVYDERSPQQAYMERMAQDQGLVDVSGMLSFSGVPAGVQLAKAAGSGVGLGAQALSGAMSIPYQAGRREALRNIGQAGAVAGGAGIAAQPLVKAVGLGLGDDVARNIAVGSGRAPISIAKLENMKNLSTAKSSMYKKAIKPFDDYIDDVYNQLKGKKVTVWDNGGQQLTRPITRKDVGMNIENYYVSERGDFYGGLKTSGWLDMDKSGISKIVNSRTGQKYSNLPDSVFDSINKASHIDNRIYKIQRNANSRIEKAIKSKEPVLSPPEIKTQINKLKTQKAKFSNKNFYQKVLDKDISSLQNQLNTLSKTGKYGKLK